jgi:hypothetical protein
LGSNKYRVFPLLAILLVTACADYEFSVNDRLVYTPLPLFSDYALPDAGLHDCVSQTISDERITRAELLQTLNCSHAGIKSMVGLDRFTHLHTLNLGDNQLREVTLLRSLGELRRVNLEGNPDLDCASVGDGNGWVELRLPLHCR